MQHPCARQTIRSRSLIRRDGRKGFRVLPGVILQGLGVEMRRDVTIRALSSELRFLLRGQRPPLVSKQIVDVLAGA